MSTKKILFAGLFCLLCLPLLQKELPFFPEKGLKGAVTYQAKPKFSWRSWWHGSFQKNQELYAKDHVGGRASLVRLHNQLDYSLFGKINANGIDVGKEGYLFERGYIYEYLGKNFVGKAKIDENTRRVKLLQDSLAKLDKTLLVVLAAGKGSYFPEYFPEKFQNYPKTISNYEYYKQTLTKSNVNLIDFNQWFLEMKDTTSYPLFPKTGIHWSDYAEYLVADSLINYIEEVRNIDLPEIICEDVEWHNPPIKRDRDIEEGMNLIQTFDNFEMPYPKIRFETDGKTPLNAMIVADSYYWGLQNMGFTNQVFDEGHFWYYNNSIHPNVGAANKVVDVDLLEQVAKKDIIILLATEATLPAFAWGFVHNLYMEWFEPQQVVRQKKLTRVEQKINEIKSDASWMEHIREKAAQNGISVDSMLYKDAVYLLESNQ